MGLFKNILEKLGIKKDEKEVAKPAAVVKPTTGNVRPVTTKPVAKPVAKPAADYKPINPTGGTLFTGVNKPAEMAMVDVVSKLDGLAKANPQKLDWKVSIVDLLKLLDIDSSLASRKELAAELGCPADQMGGDNSKMNVWLHKTVLKKIAENGGNIPPSLLD